jgi:hypothetical protein
MRILSIFALSAIAAPAMSFAGSCPRTISACGCVIESRGSYSVGGALSLAGAGDCIAIKADSVELDLAGYSLTGPAAPAPFSAGVHITRRASGAAIVGGGGAISQFTDGILIEGKGATISGFSANGNEEGVVLDGREAELTNFSASGNSGDGVALFGAAQARISDFTASGNAANGVDILSKRVKVSGFTADSNGYAGVLIRGIITDLTPHAESV